MKELIGFEIKKSMNKPIVLAIIIGILLMDVLMIFFGKFQGEPTFGMPYSKEKVVQIKKERLRFSGVIDDNWIQDVKNTQNNILNNSNNQVSGEERKKITQKLIEEGLTEDYINSPNSVHLFVKEEVLDSREFQSLEDPMVSSGFYDAAEKKGKEIADDYRINYGGSKGKALSWKAEEMYGYLSNEYKAYYDYSWGWSRLHAMQIYLPFTVGVLLVVALSPMFSNEYSSKMDSLILSSKQGKSKLIKAKMIAGYSIAILSWLSIQIINIIIILSVFGVNGWKAFMQNWSHNPSPYAFNYFTSYCIVSAISFVGLLFLTSMILFISSKSKSIYTSLIISAGIIIMPKINIHIFRGVATNNILMFLPTNILIAVNYFKTFEAFYIFGEVIMAPYMVAVVASLLSMLLGFLAYLRFKRHEVEN
ncbi:hypothetical protein KPL26_04700 [Clostridium algidicarnis]|uniref:ABC transporter permease subunit n=1 Tax=Clostridium algidicarnis TaxID=37659 RepID=UPI001C0C5D75|nr:ABC transporter permease subunit [Clostridium algidicarnis]MBU3195966.1 hypothetical protein [Clostridium algidicarnis]